MNREHRKDDWNIETAREEALHDAVEQARRLDELYEAAYEACAECGRVDIDAFMCWRVGHLPKDTP
jgi:hypothetical protein